MSALRSSIVVGRHGEGQLRGGWHDRERDGRHGVPFHACGREGALELARLPDATRLSLILNGPVGLAQGPLVGRVTVNGRRFELPLEVDAWVLRRYPLESGRPVLQVRLELESPPIPDNVLHNGDTRELGWMLSAIWQE